MIAYVYLITLLITFYFTYTLLYSIYYPSSDLNRLDRTDNNGTSINIIPKKGLIIQLHNYHNEYIGIAIEYFIKMKYEIYIYQTPYNKEWITFFKANYIGFPIYITENLKETYDYVFYTTLTEMYQIKYLSDNIGGIIYKNISNDSLHKFNKIDMFSLSSSVNGTKIKNYFNLNKQILRSKQYKNNFYPESEYFIISDLDEKEKINDSINHILNLSLITTIFSQQKKKCLITSKHKDSSIINRMFNATTYLYKSNVIIHNEINVTDLIKCFMYKKIILIDSDQIIFSPVLYLAASFNTPIYLNNKVYKKYPEYEEFNFIPYKSDEHLYELLEQSPTNFV